MEKSDRFNNKVIYHYTSADNLKSILESKELWLSDITTCNDSMEQKWLLEILQEKKEAVLYNLLHEAVQEDKRIIKPLNPLSPLKKTLYLYGEHILMAEE